MRGSSSGVVDSSSLRHLSMHSIEGISDSLNCRSNN